LHYMRAYEIDPAGSAMGILVQRMVDAEASGGAFSLSAEDRIVITATWGLGSAIAQGEIIPDRYVVNRDTSVEAVEPGRKEHLVRSAGAGPDGNAVPRQRAEKTCRTDPEAYTTPRR